MSARRAMFAIENCCSEMNKGARNSSRETVLSNLVGFSCTGGERDLSIRSGLSALFRFDRTDGQGIGLHLVPLLNLEPLFFKQRANLIRAPSDDVFENGNNDGERVVAD